MSPRVVITALVLAMIAVASCVPVAPEPQASALLQGTQWVLQTLNGQPPLAGTAPTVEFSGGEIRGSTGCNTYFGAYATAASRLTIANVGMTEMACMEPAGVMDQERAFLGALAAVASYRMSTERLELLDESGKVVLAFGPPAPMPEVTLEGTEWSLTTFVEGEAASSLLTGTAITLWFEEGRVSGAAGCNKYFGPYTLERGSLRIGAIGMTKMHCSEPAGVMGQETRYVNTLQDVTIFEWDARQLTLRTSDGRALVFSVAADTVPGPGEETPLALATPVSREPAAGICARTVGDWVTITIYPDVPDPRCAKIEPGQMLKILNGTTETLLISLAGFQASIKPGGEHEIPVPFGEYLAPGVHSLGVSPCCGPELWLKDVSP